MGKKRLLINTRELFYMAVLFPFIRIEALALSYGIVDNIYDVLKIISFTMVLLKSLYVFGRRFTISNPLFNTVVSLSGLAFVSCLFNGNSVMNVLIRYLSYITMALLLLLVYYQEDRVNFIHGAALLFSCLLCINFLAMLMKPDGIFIAASQRENMLMDKGVPVFLLGKANALTPSMLVMMLFIGIDDYNTNGMLTIRSLCYAAVTGLSIFIMGSATGIVGYGLCIVLYIYGKLKYYHNKRTVDFKLLFIFSILLSVGIVFFNAQSYLSYFITTILHKDITLSNRTNVWFMVMKYIKEKFSVANYLIGTGMLDYRKEVFAGRYAHSHNQFLDAFMQTGAIGLLLYIRIFYLSMRNVVQQYKQMQNSIMFFVGIVILSITVMFSVEVYSTPLVILVAAIGYYSDVLIKEKNS